MSKITDIESVRSKLRLASLASKWWHIRKTAAIIKQGGVIAYPTETVWGLGCDPSNKEAVHRILEMKRRPEAKGLILLTGQPHHLDGLFNELPVAMFEKFVTRTNSPTTWLVPDPLNQIPFHVKGAFDSVAIRLTDYAIVAELTACFGGPIISTSANRAGKAPADSVLKLTKIFGDELDYILPAPLGGFEKPSTIRDLASDKVFRA